MKIMFGFLLLSMAGCHWGQRADRFAPATTPAGAQARVRLNSALGERRGELYAVDSAGVFLHDGRLRHIDWSVIQRFEVLRMGDAYTSSGGAVPGTDTRARVARVSRFPQGLEGELLSNVLTLLRQPALERTTGESVSPAPRDSLDSVGAPGAPGALDSLAAATSRLTARYAERRTAMTDGYRRIGTDFPAMGEHWLHPGALIAGRLDAARPTLLSYVDIEGRPALAGVGFVVTTQGDSTARDVPGWPEHWHEHSGLLGDESGVSGVSGVSAASDARARTAHSDAHRAPATRVWVLHIWTEVDNPAGRYRADNWALPFARVGLPAPTMLDDEIARAFSLATGGRPYLEAVLVDAKLLQERNGPRVRAALDAATRAAELVRERAQTAGIVAEHDVHALREVWRTLAGALRELCGDGVEAILSTPRHH